MSMFRKVLMTIGLLLMANFVLAQGTIKGTITDPKTGEPVAFANVVAKQDGKQIKGTVTDMEGNFTIKPLDVGQYDIQASCVGYQSYTRQGFNVKASGISVCNIEMSATSITLVDVEIIEQKNPLIDIGSATQGQTMSSEDIARMPATSVEGIVASVGGVTYDDGGAGSARGESGMVTLVNGARKRTGVNVPKGAIAEIAVVLGGTPASVGEAIGAYQSITLKPPTSQFHGEINYRTILDYRLYNYLSLYLTGPVFTQPIKDENGTVTGDRTLVGFRFTAQGSFQHNSFYRTKDYTHLVVDDAIVREIEQSPIIYDPIGGSVNYAAEFLRTDDFVEMRRPTARDFGGDASRVPDTRKYTISTELAFDIRFSDYATLALTGDFTFSHSPQNSIDPLNMPRSANQVTRNMGWCITADLTQRFPDAEASTENTEGSSKSGKSITNVMYEIMGMYEVSTSHSYNEVFGSTVDDAFKYGYNGRLFTNQEATYELVPSFDYNGINRAAHVQNGWVDRIDWSTYEPYAPNQVLANYNLQLLNIPDVSSFITNFDMLRYFKGLSNGDLPENGIYGLINHVGIQGTGIGYATNQYIYLTAKAKAEIKGHELEIGFQYDRVDESYYGLSAYKLWTIMRQNANRHISQLDLSNPNYRWEGSNLYVDYSRLYNPDAQSEFDRSMRSYLGWAGDPDGERRYLDIDRYTPEDYIAAGGVDMFSTDELFAQGGNSSLVSYYGYDHTGKKYSSSNWSLNDFYNPENPKYRYLPSFHPTYMAGYLQDQFYFSDLIFNVGVRVDIFDAEQDVLKDPYLLYESYTVGQLKAANGDIPYQGEIYAGAGNDWTVYVDAADADNPTIYGYRSGSTWYDVNGVELSTPASIAGKSGKPTPYRTPAGQQALRDNNVGAEAFTDYKPQVVVMPRIAFSFPIAEEAQFKASYDIIARRPGSDYWRADYYSYLYMNQISLISNPNLKPEKITNYELAFQQALNKTSALSVSAYYKETRDLVQIVQYVGADPNQNYYSYDNLDFKTIKGLTLSYDLRQSKNIRINANYTLQYAEGTGLPQSTMLDLIRDGYTTLKMLNPIGDDRRHEFKLDLDYRYGHGAKYNGPVINRVVKDKETGEDRKVPVKLLEDFGMHLQAYAQSGAPYTRQFSHKQATIVGSYNGARLPWNFYCNLQLDKTFVFKVGKHETMLQAIVSVTNIFDIRNIKSVWPVTGNPEDDGYLTDPETQNDINQHLDAQSYRDLRTITYLNNYWRYSQPRSVMLQLLYTF